MTKPYHHGIVIYHFSILVKSTDHQTCLSISKRVKDYLSAWHFGCSHLTEYKSARKGDVLNREIQAKFKGYPANVIAFREGLRCICFHYDLLIESASVEIIDRRILPKDILMEPILT